MAFISDIDRVRIAGAIREVQKQTQGELVAVIANQADEYRFVPLLWAGGLALLVPLPLMPLVETFSSLQIYEIQIALFLAAALILRWPPIKMRLVPQPLKRQQAGRLARTQFLDRGLHHAKGGMGIMIFVAVAERYVEIMADQGIDDQVPPGTWESIVTDFVATVRAGRVADAFVGAVEECGQHLAEQFPAHPEFKGLRSADLIEM